MTYFEDCFRVYKQTGRLAHLLSPFDSPSLGYPPALCGQELLFGHSWLGTGTQHERDKAAAMPLCTKCAHKAGVV